MKRGIQGRLEQHGASTHDGYAAYIPNPLPPEPQLQLTDELHDLLERLGL